MFSLSPNQQKIDVPCFPLAATIKVLGGGGGRGAGGLEGAGGSGAGGLEGGGGLEWGGGGEDGGGLADNRQKW